MDARLQRYENRLWNILVGVMLCLVTGAITMSIAIYTVISNSISNHEAGGALFKASKAIITNLL
jgi:hypothetical protein